MSCKFDRTNQRCNDEKLALGKLVESYKKEYNAEVRANAGKTKYDEKRKVHVAIKPTWGFVARAVREFYTDLKDVQNNDLKFTKALKVAKRTHENLDKLLDPSQHPAKRARGTGGRPEGEIARLFDECLVCEKVFH